VKHVHLRILHPLHLSLLYQCPVLHAHGACTNRSSVCNSHSKRPDSDQTRSWLKISWTFGCYSKLSFVRGYKCAKLLTLENILSTADSNLQSKIKTLYWVFSRANGVPVCHLWVNYSVVWTADKLNTRGWKVKVNCGIRQLEECSDVCLLALGENGWWAMRESHNRLTRKLTDRSP